MRSIHAGFITKMICLYGFHSAEGIEINRAGLDNNYHGYLRTDLHPD